jgi:hypothetical protein
LKINKKIHVGIGFVTGRKAFKNVVQTYIEGWGAEKNKDFALHLFVAYDLKYSSTKATDYKISDEGILDIVDSAHYLSATLVDAEAQSLIDKKIITASDAKLIFGEGYAMNTTGTVLFVSSPAVLSRNPKRHSG